MMSISFHNADIKFSLPNRVTLRRFINHQITESSNHQIVSLSFIFCSDEYLLDINKKFLNHDYYTDIITFPLVQTEEELEAEIYISIDRVKENAAKFKVKSPKPKANDFPGQSEFMDELHRVIFHGVLHLLGYKDKTKPQQAEMRKMEDVWLAKYEREKTKQVNNGPK